MKRTSLDTIAVSAFAMSMAGLAALAAALRWWPVLHWAALAAVLLGAALALVSRRRIAKTGGRGLRMGFVAVLSPLLVLPVQAGAYVEEMLSPQPPELSAREARDTLGYFQIRIPQAYEFASMHRLHCKTFGEGCAYRAHYTAPPARFGDYQQLFTNSPFARPQPVTCAGLAHDRDDMKWEADPGLDCAKLDELLLSSPGPGVFGWRFLITRTAQSAGIYIYRGPH